MHGYPSGTFYTKCTYFSLTRSVRFNPNSCKSFHSFSRNAILVENFSQGTMGEPLRLPPDKEDRIVTIRTAQGSTSFTCHYPDSLLTAARKNNIPLPYSCEAGRCGSCVMLCSSGKVWHALDEVLTAGDIANGLALTCTGHPVGGDVVLQM